MNQYQIVVIEVFTVITNTSQRWCLFGSFGQVMSTCVYLVSKSCDKTRGQGSGVSWMIITLAW